MPQKPGDQKQLLDPAPRDGEAATRKAGAEASSATNGNESPGTGGLMELVCERQNLLAAMKRVRKNKGSPGIDRMTVEQLHDFLVANWERIRGDLLADRYRPQPVRRVVIPKPDGGERELGIPTVLDRLIQQALLQVLQPLFDPTFSQHSYGFRPGRSAHDAVRRAKQLVQEGRGWVVDIDLAKFFDRVNHDMLMGRLAKRIADKRVLRLIRGYLEAGVLADGLLREREEGTPQGGPLSPLLANVFLDDIDKELEKRGHAFVRYADDLNVYVRSERAGERVMESLKRLFAKHRLQVNESKSAAAPVTERGFLGFSLLERQKGELRIRIDPQRLARFKDRVRTATRRTIGRNLQQVVLGLSKWLPGWKNYFCLTEHWELGSLDSWIRHRLRALQLKLWRTTKRTFNAIRARGLSVDIACQVAAHVGRWWFGSGKPMNLALPNRYFRELGLPQLAP
ncbi:MAG: group II intron reverse transcriptase/maturase [Sandaracinus sp.]